MGTVWPYPLSGDIWQCLETFSLSQMVPSRTEMLLTSYNTQIPRTVPEPPHLATENTLPGMSAGPR